eukprot:1138377-Pelagomonas_calceolata.AAC.1
MKEKNIPRAKGPFSLIDVGRVFSAYATIGTGKVSSSAPCLILVMRVERSLLKSALLAQRAVSLPHQR